MKINIPTMTMEMVDDKVKKIRGEIEVDIDTSFAAHLKWDEHFKDEMKIDLTTFTERLKPILLNETKAKKEIMTLLKLLYCYIDSPKLPTFKSFVKIFEPEIADEILGKIGSVLEQVGRTASKN
ncbi:MAG: hypothetical protein PF487_13460 [Bacteroidales bacterium]|jgi:hypothetical protein|nr:hypothetical protein [Bacteroidales bacterium]